MCLVSTLKIKTMDELNCTVCQEQFDENNHIPRTLRCGHMCCGPCLAAILSGRREQRLCPECRQILKDTQVARYPISYTLLRLVRAIAGGEALPVSNQSRGPGTEPNAGTCSTHGTPLCFRCMKCDVWLCYTCRSTHNLGAACTVIPVSQALPIYKQSQVDRIEKAITDANEIKTATKTVREKVSKQIQKLMTEKRKLDERVQQANNWITVLEGYEAQVVEATAGKTVERAVEESRKHCMEFDTWKDENSLSEPNNGNIIQIESGVPTPFEDLRLRLQYLKKIYSKIDSSSRAAWTQITIDGQKFLLHSARQEEPPNGATIIPWRTIKQNMQDSNQLCFFDVEWNGRFEGRVYLRMLGSTPRGKNFVLLCTGEAGPCYKGTRLFPDNNLTNYSVVRGGDWEFDDLTGGKTAQSTIQINDDGIYKKKVYPGLLSGMATSDSARLSQFIIDLKHGRGQREECSFGRVENGLAIVKSAHQAMPEAIPVIMDCGFVIDI